MGNHSAKNLEEHDALEEALRAQPSVEYDARFKKQSQTTVNVQNDNAELKKQLNAIRTL